MPDIRTFPSAPLLYPTLSVTVGTLCGLLLESWWPAVIVMELAMVAVAFRQRYMAMLMCLVAIGSIRSLSYVNRQYPQYLEADKEYLIRGHALQTREALSGQSIIFEVDSVLNVISEGNYGVPTNEVLDILITDFEPQISTNLNVTLKVNPQLPDTIKSHPEEHSIRINPRNSSLRCIVSPDDILAVSYRHDFKSKLINLRNDLTELIYSSNLKPDVKPFINAIVTGYTGDISTDTRDDFKQAGISHILAISGLHVGLFTILIAIALFPMDIIGWRKWRLLLTILIIWCYALLTGLAPSVVRAAIMISILLTSRLLQRKPAPINALLFAALLIELCDPEAILSIGFQLSFLSVLAILTLAPLLNPISPKKRFPYHCVDFISVSVAAMIGTGIITIIYFHYFPVYFLLANITTAIILPPLLFLSITYIIFLSIGFDCHIFASLIDGCFSIITESAKIVSLLPGSTISEIEISPWLVIPYFATVLCLHFALSSHKIKWIVSTSVSFILFVSCCIFLPSPTSKIYPGEIIILCNKSHTDILIYDRTHIVTVVTSAPQIPNDVKNFIYPRFNDYMRRRSVDSLRVVPEYGHRQNVFVSLDTLRLALIVSSVDKSERANDITYAVIDKDYHESVDEVIDRLHPDTIIISFDVAQRQADKIKASCNEREKPCFWLRERLWRYTSPICR